MINRRLSEQNLIANEEDAAGEEEDEDGIEYNNTFSPAVLSDIYQNPQLRQTAIITKELPPLDRYNFIYVVFYLLGCATMTPWNFFVTAEDYWMYKFRNTTSNESNIDVDLTPMQRSFACDLTLTASISGTTFLILNAIYGQLVSLRLKMAGCMCIILIIFIITTIFVEINTDSMQEQFFLITLFTVILINISSATMSGGIFGAAGLFPSQYMTALVSGQALGGIFTALALIMVLTFEAGPKTTAFIFFSIGTSLILLCLVLFVLMYRSRFYTFYINGDDKCSIVYDRSSSIEEKNDGATLEPNTRIVFGKIYMPVVSISILYATTLSVYPAVSELMQSENAGNGKAWNDVYYVPVVNFLFFNSGDYFGRILAGIWERPRNCSTALLMTMLRILYIPFFLCSNTNAHYFLPTLVHSDGAFIAMILSFAIINGYLTNLLLIMAPRQVSPHEREIASSIMAAALSCGLAFGSVLSMIFVQLL